jgi:glucokinase
MRVLVGDIGGTKTGLALAEVSSDQVRLTDAARYPSREHGDLADIVRLYLDESGARVDAGSFAIAGPVVERRSKTTNLPWAVDADAMERALGIARVHLLNDLEAVAWGIAALGAEDLAEIQPGAASAVGGNACVVAAGTGLGEAGLYWDGSRHQAFATEGGHTDFAPADEREFALLNHLQQHFGRVSWERVVSGMGIGNLYGFLPASAQGSTMHPPAVAAGTRRARATLPAAVADHRLVRMPCMRRGHGPVRAASTGAKRATMALKLMALGGVYLGGGIAPKNLDLLLRRSNSCRASWTRAECGTLMERMPVRVILNQQRTTVGRWAVCLPVIEVSRRAALY